MTKGEEILRNIKENDPRFKDLKIEKRKVELPPKEELFFCLNGKYKYE